MTCSLREMTSSSGKTGLKSCRILRLPIGPLPTELVVVAKLATENRWLDEAPPMLMKELRATDRNEALEDRLLVLLSAAARGPPPPPPPVMKGAKGRGSLPSSV